MNVEVNEMKMFLKNILQEINEMKKKFPIKFREQYWLYYQWFVLEKVL